jgi:hypothetical protein
MMIRQCVYVLCCAVRARHGCGTKAKSHSNSSATLHQNLPLSAIVSTLDRGGRVQTLAYGSNALVDVLAQNGSIGGGMWWAQDTVREGIRDLRSIQSCELEAHDIAKYFE